MYAVLFTKYFHTNATYKYSIYMSGEGTDVELVVAPGAATPAVHDEVVAVVVVP